MARAKNTERAEARRRYRAARAAQLGISEDELDAATAAPTPAQEAAPPPRAGFRFPDVRADIAALPGMYRSRRLLWLPVILLLIGFALQLAVSQRMITDEGTLGIAVYYLQAVFYPTGLLIFVVAGFVAPRAPYLVGFLMGVLDATLLTIALLAIPAPESAGAANAALGADITTGVLYIYLLGIAFGTFGGAFGAWYRNVFRKSQERSRARADERRRKQEAQAVADRRSKRQARQPSR